MKIFNTMIAAVLLWYFGMTVFAVLYIGRIEEDKNRGYLVEVNMIMKGLEKEGTFSKPNLDGMEYLQEVSYLSEMETENINTVQQFYRKVNGTDRHIEPLYKDNKVLGYLRFDYRKPENNSQMIYFTAGILLFSGVMMAAFLTFIKFKILKPFQKLSSLPFELAKGRLDADIKENKSHFFGRFIWGISMLRDSLKSSKIKEMKLEREKKLLLLSISHDIKTPLNTIKLYAKALEEGLYESEEKRQQAAQQIEKRTLEIEGFVKEIVKTSSDDILNIEVENSEFYLKSLVDMIKEYYAPKCRLRMLDFTLGDYDNRLLKGSVDKVFEAVENIMENAFKYGDGRSIEISFYEEDYCQLIQVRNSGIPVSVNEMPHLFDSFYRGSNVGGKEGNGLGLYICRKIMRKMEGDIFAEREENGMSVTLVLR